MRRITRYWCLIGPTRKHVFGDDATLTVEYVSSAPGLELPASMLALYLAFVVEKARLISARPMIPVAASVEAPEDRRHTLARYLAVMPRYGEMATLSFARADSTTSFRSEAQGLWHAMEQDLERQIAARARSSDLACKVVSALLTQLPLGHAYVFTIYAELGVSRSTPQRRLCDEATTFQEIFDTTCKDLALRYQTKSTLANKELAHLLAYSEPSSFFRCSAIGPIHHHAMSENRQVGSANTDDGLWASNCPNLKSRLCSALLTFALQNCCHIAE